MIQNGKRKVDELKLKRDTIAKEADEYESESREINAKAKETEGRVKELTKEMLKLETNRDRMKAKEVELSERIAAVEKKLGENKQTDSLLREKTNRIDGIVKTLLSELCQLEEDNNVWQNKYQDIVAETKICEETLRKRAKTAEIMQFKSKNLEQNVVFVQNSAKCVEMESFASKRRNSAKEERICLVSLNLPTLKATFKEREKKAGELERQIAKKEEELKQLKENYNVMKDEFESLIADIGH